MEHKTVEISPSDAKLHEVVDIEPARKRYTLMVYMIGSNLESRNGAATDDLKEMLGAGVDFSQSNILVYAGGTKRWNTDIPAGHNSILDLSRPEGDRVVAQTDSTPSMGAPQTLAEFVNYCEKLYPAEHVALVFWDHGGGPLWGYGLDEVNGNDGLLLQEMRQAMEETPYAADDLNLDWVGFDACLMGSLENVALWQEYARYMVASEEVEPGAGWDYAFLSVLNQSNNPQDIGKRIVDAYGAYYEGETSAYANPDVSLACFDLGLAPGAVDAADDLLSHLTECMAQGGYADVSRARRESKLLGLAASGDRASGYDLVDLCDFAHRVEELAPEQSQKLVAAIEDMSDSFYTNADRMSGVSLYVPGDNRELFDTYYQLEELAHDARNTKEPRNSSDAGEESTLSKDYDKFVDAYAEAWTSTSEVDWTVEAPVSTDEGLSVQLTPEQVGALSSATYTVLSYDDAPDMYSIHTSDVRVEPDGEGRIAIPKDPRLVTLSTDIGEGRAHIVQFSQVEQEGNRSVWTNSTLTLEPAGDFYSGSESAINVDLSTMIELDEVTESLTIRSLTANDGTIGAGGKNAVDVSNYSHIYIPVEYYIPRYDDEGRVLPWREWEFSGAANAFDPPIEHGFSFVVRHASDYGYNWACQIILTDVNGDEHALEPAVLPVDNKKTNASREVVCDTELGHMTFEIEGNQTTLKKYEGADWTVEIPTEVEGVPVTTVGNGAFAGCKYLDELVIPEGITSIGQSAFANSGVYALTLPSTLVHVAPAAFREMGQLESFNLNGANLAVSVRDGVLYSADGKTLVAYPNARSATYQVPHGVEVIGYGAFAKTDIRHVEFPEGLKSIDRAAFFGCLQLDELNLPNSLTDIGALAFGAYHNKNYAAGTDVGTGYAHIGRLHIGPKVNHIGDRAFSGVIFDAFEVDPANETYSSKGGTLFNAAGDTLLEMPQMREPVHVVPDGTVTLDARAFADFPADAEFVLPASLATCDTSCFPYEFDRATDTRSYSCVIHAPKDSFAYGFAIESEMPHDSETDVQKLMYNTATLQRDGYDLEFRVYHDHAMLVDISYDEYARAEHVLQIPASAGGVPVTSIGLRSTSGLVETLVLPSTLNSLEDGDGGIGKLYDLKRIDVETENTSLIAQDGVLYSIDKDVLVAFPCKREGGFEIPEGVHIVGERAFGRCSLREVIMPASIEEIAAYAFSGSDVLEHVRFGRRLQSVGDYAFYKCKTLRLDAELPKGVTSIGKSAFSGIGDYSAVSLPEDLESLGEEAFYCKDELGASDELAHVESGVLHIGEYLNEIPEGSWYERDRGIFGGLDITGFEVARSNETYCAEGPFLLAAKGLNIIAFADGISGEVRIPKGAKVVDGDLFECAYRVTDIFIPPSVKVLRWPVYQDDEDHALDHITVHVVAGSFAERYARERGLSWVVE